MHSYGEDTAHLAEVLTTYAYNRAAKVGPLNGITSYDELYEKVGETITPQGLGYEKAFDLFRDVLVKYTVAQDNPANVSFVPAAPTKEASLFDMVVGVSSIYAGTWLEGAGAVYAENQALRWICDLAGFGPNSGGVFVSGGTTANLSALVAARYDAALKRRQAGIERPSRWRVAASEQSHASIAAAAEVMDIDVAWVPTDDRYRLTGEQLAPVLAADEDKSIFAVVATAGTTNAGIIDNLDTVGTVAKKHGAWLHVDGAYGGAALCVPERRDRFKGIELADSFVVDPHKWFFSTFDCAALIYKDPNKARQPHTQRASYLDPVTDRVDDWNPSEYAIHLSRRARGLPFWFSLSANGTDAYVTAVRTTLSLAEQFSQMISDCDYTELLRPINLSVVLFKRNGWTKEQYYSWSRWAAEQELCFMVPSSWMGEPCLRACIINPQLTTDQMQAIIDSLAEAR